MAYAQHSIQVGGEFINEYGITFEYSLDKSEHCWDKCFSDDYENSLYDKCNAVIYVNDIHGVNTRCALVKKTVCYFITSDWEHNTVWEKMKIHSHKTWNHFAVV